MITIEFNADAARSAIREAIAKLEDMTPIFNSVGEYMRESTRLRFQKGVDPEGKAWAPKSAATLERYRRKGWGNKTKPLQLFGKLSGGIVIAADRQAVVIGSPAIQAAVMQFGAAKGAFGADRRGRPIPWGRIPARAFIGISASDERAIVEEVEEQLAAVLDAKS